MVSRGKFVLHSRADPALTAGDYVLTGKQTIKGLGDRATAPYETNLRVTSPRFRMPPDQILSTFPPANSEGAYESRLPQIVLKRRTLPWDRLPGPPGPAGTREPWLALVVIAEGEGQISVETPVADCVTPGVVLAGPNDVASGVYLSVPQTTVQKVFPTKADLQLLAHVREVDLEDTELASGDDDGFLAVVLANRLPQYDRIGCKPVRYTACLINLEGQLDVLPPPSTPVFDFGALATVFDARILYAADPGGGGGSPDKLIMAGMSATATMADGLQDVAPASIAAAKLPVAGQMRKATPSLGAASDWRAATSAVTTAALEPNAALAGMMVRDAMKDGFRLPIEGRVLEPVYRFPLLAHWSFTCDGGGSFGSLMTGLDVGLLGTLPGPNAKKKRPECAKPPGGTAPPDPALARPDPEVAATGHVGLAHKTRLGDLVRAWYRGPFVPLPTERELPGSGGKPLLAHTSDQLRIAVPDGREDLSLAVAFEIGRLLALAQPAIVGAMARWRREQYGAARARRLAALAGASIAKIGAIIGKSAIASLAPLVGRTLVLETASKRTDIFGRFRPPVDPGRPIPFLDDDVSNLLAVGLAVEPTVLDRLRDGGGIAAVQAATVPLGPSVRDAARFAHLSGALAAEVQRIAGDALSATEAQGDAADAGPQGAAGETGDGIDRIIRALGAARAGRRSGDGGE